jgi:hypothetical protein
MKEQKRPINEQNRPLHTGIPERRAQNISLLLLLLMLLLLLLLLESLVRL